MATDMSIPSDDSARLGLFDTVSLIVGIVVGASIYQAPSTVFGSLNCAGAALGMWAVGGVLSLIGAFCYAELATAYPRPGGDYVYLTRAYGSFVGFLFGFVTHPFGSPTDGAVLETAEGTVGYVHLVGIHPDYRRRGVARLLYAAFEDDCRAAGCASLKAITTLGDQGSVKFHQALGWSVREVDDYAGPARARIVFQKSFD